MAFDRFRKSFLFVLAPFVVVTTAACVSTPYTSGDKLAPAGDQDFRQIDDLILVDCLLPGQIRQLGTRMTYLAPRRRVKTTKSDCGIRGGEFVLFDRSDYRTALQELLPKAQGGDAVSQTYVGEIYEKGWGLPAPDHAAAARWYRAAAKSGHRPAQTNLGSLYERGLGVSKDKAKALDWYRKATGVTEDRVIFESQLKAEREAFQKEIALRNRVASSLRQQLQRKSVSAAPKKSAQVAAPAPNKRELERVAESLRRDVASEATQVERQLHAVEQLKKAEETEKTKSSESSKKAAQMGKLELSLRQRSDALADNRRRLASVQ